MAVNFAEMCLVAWDSAANISFAKDYGLVTKGQDTADILAESKAGLEYFAAVRTHPFCNWH